MGVFEAALRQLCEWRAALEGMPLCCAAALLQLDAAPLQAALLPRVLAAQDGIASLLLQLRGPSRRRRERRGPKSPVNWRGR